MVFGRAPFGEEGLSRVGRDSARPQPCNRQGWRSQLGLPLGQQDDRAFTPGAASQGAPQPEAALLLPLGVSGCRCRLQALASHCAHTWARSHTLPHGAHAHAHAQTLSWVFRAEQFLLHVSGCSESTEGSSKLKRKTFCWLSRLTIISLSQGFTGIKGDKLASHPLENQVSQNPNKLGIFHVFKNKFEIIFQEKLGCLQIFLKKYK